MKNGYGFEEIFNNIFSLIYTKIFFKKARLIRRPIYVRGKKMFRYGEGFTTGYGCRLEMFNIKSENDKKLTIGKNCKIGDHVHIAAGESVNIGDDCLFASKVYISDISHGNYSGSNSDSPQMIPDSRTLITKPVSIGDKVWIGENVCVLPGVRIGNGVIVGANAVVNKNIPDNCIVAGVPAKIIKVYNFEMKEWSKYES